MGVQEKVVLIEDRTHAFDTERFTCAQYVIQISLLL